MSKIRAAFYRAGRTATQTALALIGTAQLVSVDWKAVALGVAGATVTSLLTSAVTDLPEAG